MSNTREEPMWKIWQRRKARKATENLDRVYGERIEFMMAQIVLLTVELEAVRVRLRMMEAGSPAKPDATHEAPLSVH